MASNKFKELQEFSDEELINELKESEVQQQKRLFDHAIKGLDNPISLRGFRRDIARLKTEVRRRELHKMNEEELGNRSKIRFRRRKK